MKGRNCWNEKTNPSASNSPDRILMPRVLNEAVGAILELAGMPAYSPQTKR
jgi:hypothetical protein